MPDSSKGLDAQYHYVTCPVITLLYAVSDIFLEATLLHDTCKA